MFRVLLAAVIAWLVLAAFRVGEAGSWLLQDTVAVVVGGVGAIVIAVLIEQRNRARASERERDRLRRQLDSADRDRPREQGHGSD